MDKITVLKDGELITERDVDCDLTIGRSDENDIVLPDTEKYVSRKHAKIQRREDGFYIADSGSQNGIIIDGAKVEEAKLDRDTEIRIGKFQINFIKEKKEDATTIMSQEGEADEEDAGTMIISKDEPEADEEPAEEGTMVKAAHEKKSGPQPKVGSGEFEIPSGLSLWIKYPVLTIAAAAALSFIFFKKSGSVVFEVQPAGAQIQVNGIMMPEAGSGKLRNIGRGTYRIQITHPEYVQPITGNLELGAKKRHLRVIANPQGMEVVE